MSRSTPLLEEHEKAGARIVDFAGWRMPVQYGSLIEEHHAVRRACGMFDVSHMTVVDLSGERCTDYLRRVLANDVARIQEPGRALYTCMLAEDGGVLDDLIVYFHAPDRYRLVVNAATREKDLEWLRRHAADFAVDVAERAELAMIAVQGPKARETAAPALPADADTALALKPFRAADCGGWFVARTGYTGEDGWEIVLPADDAPALWRDLVERGVAPCGLGARDTLRLEAGLNLYGSDMDETTTPLESGLAWTVAMDPPDRDFVGRTALERQAETGVPRKLVGLLLEARGVLRGGQPVLVDGEPTGVVTSGTFSPTMERSIALARVPAATGEQCEVDIRGRHLPARVVQPPFVRGGKIKIEL